MIAAGSEHRALDDPHALEQSIRGRHRHLRFEQNWPRRLAKWLRVPAFRRRGGAWRGQRQRSTGSATDAPASAGVTIPRVRALDGLRGAAVAGVLLFHGGHLIGGYLGVDLFFVLSGFLITSLLLAEGGATGGSVASVGSGPAGPAACSRARRAAARRRALLPLHRAADELRADPRRRPRDARATSPTGAASSRDQNYWALFTAPSPLQHTWSLAIEEQFYLVWPLVFVGLLACGSARAPQAVLVDRARRRGGLERAHVAPLRPRRTRHRVYYGTDTRASRILLGAALAAALAIWGPVRGRGARARARGRRARGRRWSSRWRGPSSAGSRRLYRGGFLVCGLAAVAVIAAAVHPRRRAVLSGRSRAGRCAYSA